MELTPIFNDAAQGGPDYLAADGRPNSPTPSGPSAAEAPIQATDEHHSGSSATTARRFEFAAQEPAAPTKTDEPAQTAHSQKEAMLRSLEQGRAKPTAPLNLKPSPHVEKAVHTVHEELREKRIRELQSELAPPDDPDDRYLLDTEFDDDFGPSL